MVGGAAHASAITIGDDHSWSWANTLRWAVPIAVSAIVALLVLGVNTRQTAKMHRARLDGDRALAREKTDADLALAERKVALDRELATWKRRAEVAEQTLTLFYEAKAGLVWARTSVVFSGEGKSRPPIEGEDEKTKERRDSYSVPLERLNQSRDVFAKLQSMMHLFAAYFDPEATEPFRAVIAVHNSIQSAAGVLIEMAHSEDYAPPENFAPLRRSLGWGARPDETDKKLDAAVKAMELTCHDALGRRPAEDRKSDEGAVDEPETGGSSGEIA